MKAVIMAGGEGTRLRPLTTNTPKPLLTIANKPMMEHIVMLLKSHGIDEIVVTVAFMANAIRSYFGDGQELGVKISYATEEVPLGTAGSVRNAIEELNEQFIVISGDVLTDFNLKELIEFHNEKGGIGTLALKRIENPVDFGIVICNSDGSIERFLEKPTWGQVFSDTINTGIYILEPEIFEYIPENTTVDFSSDIFPVVLEDKKSIFGTVMEGYWEDVGTLDSYLSAHKDVLDGKVKIELEGFELRPGVWIGHDTIIDPTARVEGPAVIGANCEIGDEVHLGPYTVLGDNVRVMSHCDTQRSVIMDNSFIDQSSSLWGTVIGRRCDIKAWAKLADGVVVGDGSVIGAHSSIESGVKIYPNKIVESGAVVNLSIVWEARANRSLFGRQGLSGFANIDLGPELVIRVAMAFASTIPKGSIVAASRDSSRSSRMLKRALMVGLNSCGVNVADLEVATVPLTRYAVKCNSLKGGISVRIARDNSMGAVIRFFDEDGREIDEIAQRKIERLVQREEFRQVLAYEIGDIEFPQRTAENYTADLLSTINTKRVRNRKFKLVLDYSFGTASFVMPNVLSKLGANVLVVNPYGATKRAMDFDRIKAAGEISKMVIASGADLGAVIDPDAEQITLIDSSGKVLNDEELLLAISQLYSMSSTRHYNRIAVPLSATLHVEKILEKSGVKVIRTKLSASHLIDVTSETPVDIAISTWGGVAFPEFLPAFDAVGCLVRTLDYLAETGLKLENIAEELPSINISHIEIETPFENKGALMRSYVEVINPESKVILIDGIKVMDKSGWELILPDPERPVTHVFVEEFEANKAQMRAEAVEIKVKDILSNLK